MEKNRLHPDHILQASLVNEPYEYGSEETLAMCKALIRKRPYVFTEPVEDSFGSFIMAVAPFYSSTGAFSGFVGVDLNYAEFTQTIQGIQRSALVAALISALISVVVGFVFARIRSVSLRMEGVRRQADEELRQAEKNLRDMAENVPGAIFQCYWRKNGQRGFYYMSPRADEIFGFSSETAMRKGRLYSIHPDDRDGFERAMFKAVHNQIEWTYEGRFIKHGGDIVWWRGVARPMAVTDTEMVFNGVLMDITEERRSAQLIKNSEERMRALLAALPDQVFVINGRGVYQEVKPGAKDTLKDYSCIWRTLNEVFSAETSSAFLEANTKTVQTSQLQCLEYSRKEANGVERWFEAQSAPLQLADESQAVLWVARDITERRQIEDKFRKATQAAQAANKAKSDFLANMSHEIRTPMNGVLGMVAVLENTPLNAEQKDCIEVVKSSSELLLSVINDVLDLSKIESGHMELFSGCFDLRAAIKSVIDLMQTKAAEKGIYIDLQIPPEFPSAFIGDEARIKQVLMNLVGNAVKFTDKGAVSVRVDGIRDDGASWNIKMVIEDTGVGIPTEQIGLLFQPFKQLHNYATRRYGGTGLGLAICQKLVQLMGGSICVESIAGQGSVFSVNISLRETANIEAVQPTGEIEQLAQSVPLTILLAEDNFVNQKVALKILQKMGYTADVACNGLEAVKAAEAKDYDVIMMDLQMPEMDGLEAAREIKKRLGSNAPRIIALTAHAMSDQMEACKLAGMDGFLTKPIRVHDFAAQLGSVRVAAKN
ncbi:MAG: hypothetical protein B7X06_01245 [Verrucomicrobia bacterium 21-51-4]|nr:MAG: hypothetical protein B7X06_01245 [Verrucomicrobia bacterium 21-51-4]